MERGTLLCFTSIKFIIGRVLGIRGFCGLCLIKMRYFTRCGTKFIYNAELMGKILFFYQLLFFLNVNYIIIFLSQFRF